MIVMEAGASPVSLAETQAYLRIDGGDEEALLAGLLRSATGLCEQFTGQLLVKRAVGERIRATGEWQRLQTTPWSAIDGVFEIEPGGNEVALGGEAYAIDIDAAGDGWVRLTGSSPRLVMVRGEAGMAADANGVPEPLRQGILRLTAHMFEDRSGAGGEPPAAVTALWRPYRRMRLK